MARKKIKRIYSDYPVGNSQTEPIKVLVSPNPADKQINVHIDGVIENEKVLIEIHTIDGKLVFEKQLPINAYEPLNISNLDDGVYLYSVIINKEKIKTEKLIIQH